MASEGKYGSRFDGRDGHRDGGRDDGSIEDGRKDDGTTGLGVWRLSDRPTVRWQRTISTGEDWGACLRWLMAAFAGP